GCWKSGAPMSDLYVTHRGCRVCGGAFDPLLTLGTPVLSSFLKPMEPDPPRYPLELVICRDCELTQLRHSVEDDRLYRQYWYQSAVNEAMVAELGQVAESA